MNQMDRVSKPPEPFISYSINYEDVILRRLFPGKVDGFFVDVGAQHPKLDNDFFGLYELGWRGINVEPNPSYFTLLQTIRTRDQNLQLVLSDKEDEPITFFEVSESGLSTCDEQQAMACIAQGYTIRRHDLRTSTLRRVLEQERLPHIDIMKVDVEGLEEKVLTGNDWTLFRPSVVVVEATYPETPVKRPTGIAANLASVGYRHAHFDGLNDFYVEENFIPPAGAFMPPNAFDRFIRVEMVALREDNEMLQKEIHAHKVSFSSAETYAHDLETHLSVAQAERDALQDRILELEPLASAYRNAEQEIRGLAAARDRLANDIDDLRQENRRLVSAVNQLHGENLSLNRALRPAHHTGRELAIMNTALERVYGRLDGWMQEMARRGDEVADAGRRIALAEVSAAEARLRVEALETSTSWRLTKPVRVLGRRLKGWR